MGECSDFIFDRQRQKVIIWKFMNRWTEIKYQAKSEENKNKKKNK